jgi:hypothetical protein
LFKGERSHAGGKDLQGGWGARIKGPELWAEGGSWRQGRF